MPDSRQRQHLCLRSFFIIASESWPIVKTDIDWFVNNGQNKKIYLSQVKFQLGNGLVLKISSDAALDTERLAIRYI